MYNASYLIRSRHAIFYFRYPIPTHGNRRISISLKTRCSKEALRLSKALEYHAFMLMNNDDMKVLDYADVKVILRNHFMTILDRMRSTIDADGPLLNDRVDNLKNLKADVEAAIKDERDELYENLFCEGDIPDEFSLDKVLRPIAENSGIDLNHDSKERTALRREYKGFSHRGLIRCAV